MTIQTGSLERHRFTGLEWLRFLGVEDEFDIANPDSVAGVQRLGLVQKLSVQKGSVAASQVFDSKNTVVADHASVIATDRSGFHHDVALGVAAERRDVLGQLKSTFFVRRMKAGQGGAAGKKGHGADSWIDQWRGPMPSAGRVNAESDSLGGTLRMNNQTTATRENDVILPRINHAAGTF